MRLTTPATVPWRAWACAPATPGAGTQGPRTRLPRRRRRAARQSLPRPSDRPVPPRVTPVDLVQRVCLVGGKLAEEMGQRRRPVGRGRQCLPHESRAVFGSGDGRLVTVGATVCAASQPALLMQVVHHGHHRGIRDRSVALQVTDYVAHGHGLTAGPDPLHDLSLEVAEGPHRTAFLVMRDPSAFRLVGLSTIELVLAL